MGAMGGVFADKFTVQLLTPLLWMGASSAEPETHSRFYPYTNSFVVGDKNFEFQYLTWETFLAKRTRRGPHCDQICVQIWRRSAQVLGRQWLCPQTLILRLASRHPPLRPKNAPAGMAFGFIQSVLFDAHNNIKLINFNWCGRYDVEMANNSKHYLNIPFECWKSIEKKKGTIPNIPMLSPEGVRPLS